MGGRGMVCCVYMHVLTVCVAHRLMLACVVYFQPCVAGGPLAEVTACHGAVHRRVPGGRGGRAPDLAPAAASDGPKRWSSNSNHSNTLLLLLLHVTCRRRRHGDPPRQVPAWLMPALQRVCPDIVMETQSNSWTDIVIGKLCTSYTVKLWSRL
jgi:hypothetical protein